MARQDDATKLLALGLLNYADDEGYFYACPSLVRSALRPFDDDSTIVRRSIEKLSKIGFIEVREHSTHGPVGMVLSFADHQRVDRPKASIIKELFDSTNVRRSIDDQSTLEGKGTGNREGNVKEAVASKSRPQTREEFDAYFREIDLYPRDAEATWNKWEGNGWTNSGKKIVCWKSMVRAWKASSYMPSQKTPSDYEREWPREKVEQTEPEEDDLMASFLRHKEAEIREAAGDHPDYWTEEELEAERSAGCL